LGEFRTAFQFGITQSTDDIAREDEKIDEDKLYDIWLKLSIVLSRSGKPILTHGVEQLQIAYMHLMESLPTIFDLVVMHGLSQDMYDRGNLFDHAATLYHNGRMMKFAVVGGDGSPTNKPGSPGKSWIGSDAIVEQLVERHVPREQIIVIDPIANSAEEASAITKFAQEHDCRSVGSVSTVYNGCRMFNYMIYAMRARNFWFEYYMMPSNGTNFTGEMLSSQGLKSSTILISTGDDVRKIEERVRLGPENGFNVVGFDDVIAYLSDRANYIAKQSANIDN
jgi:hypothetical protein